MSNMIEKKWSVCDLLAAFQQVLCFAHSSFFETWNDVEAGASLTAPFPCIYTPASMLRATKEKENDNGDY